MPMMELNRLGLTPIVVFNLIIWLFFTLAYFYQIVYIIRVMFKGTVRLPEAKKQHRYAFFISAHNEELVIGNLVRSIFAQDYPRELMDVFVVCDACTDGTHAAAEEAGAIVWDRNDLARRGKSWAMDYGFDRILNEYGDKYEAFIVMDADNLVSRDYIKIMNQAFDAGYLVCTGYRNSKNFDSSWVSAAYALWFMREAKFLNNARMMSGTSRRLRAVVPARGQVPQQRAHDDGHELRHLRLGLDGLRAHRPRHARLGLPHPHRGHPVLHVLLRQQRADRLRAGGVLRRAARDPQGVLDPAHALDQGLLPGVL